MFEFRAGVGRLRGSFCGLAVWALLICGMASADQPGTGGYRDGVHFPSVGGPKTRGKALNSFYRQWKAAYLAEGCGDGRAYVAVDADGKWGGIRTPKRVLTVSEAHGYGMLALVMMAGSDPDAHRLFDAMLRYFKDHPAASDPGLMAWIQLEGCEDGGGDLGGRHTATDGDLDIAYALLLAEKRWGNADEFDYGSEARTVIGAILRHEVSADGYLYVADWAGAANGRYRGLTRTSDFMLSHLAAFARATGDGRWQAVRDRTYGIISEVLAGQAKQTGLMPDFISGLPGAPAPAAPDTFEGRSDGSYGWNAARYPFRLALDDILNGEPRAGAALAPLNGWIIASTGGDPTRISNGYGLNGMPLPGQGTGSMTFVAMFAVAAMSDPDGQAWLDALWRMVVATRLAEEDYYGNTLKLLAMITLTGRWQPV